MFGGKYLTFKLCMYSTFINLTACSYDDLYRIFHNSGDSHYLQKFTLVVTQDWLIDSYSSAISRYTTNKQASKNKRRAKIGDYNISLVYLFFFIHCLHQGGVINGSKKHKLLQGYTLKEREREGEGGRERERERERGRERERETIACV